MKMPREAVSLRTAAAGDLEEINRIIDACIMTWDLPDRVKRLSLSSYRYSGIDLDFLDIVVAENLEGEILGAAAWEPADAGDTPGGTGGLLLHGIYVDPSQQRRGIGARLFSAAVETVRQRGLKGLLVKAQADANGFFTALGMQAVAHDGDPRRYANRLWMQVEP
jgi:GNAT superfamily N-acetyltransferase